jgi:hypothetical protein
VEIEKNRRNDEKCLKHKGKKKRFPSSFIEKKVNGRNIRKNMARNEK